MYRIYVLTNGKYHNVECGPRYCFTKRSAKKMIDIFMDSGCEILIHKLIRIHRDVFYFSDYDEGDSVFTYFFDKENVKDEFK